MDKRKPGSYCAAAERLHEVCEMALDLMATHTSEDWI
jgi:hypothetical protein